MRVRFRFTKHGKVRFTSHRDVARLWERALRRAELPVARTEGFSPRQKMHFGLALSTSHESDGEYLDVDLVDGAGADAVDIAALPALLSPLLPPGLEVEAAEVVDPRQPSLQQAVTSCSWLVGVARADLAPSADQAPVDPAELAAGVARLLAATELPVVRQRKGKDVHDDIRPAIISLEVAGPSLLQAELATHPRGVRPAELLAAFDPPLEEALVRRTHQWIEAGGAKREPLTATPTARAEARAS
jgi:radical SAM-linked protein